MAKTPVQVAVCSVSKLSEGVRVLLLGVTFSPCKCHDSPATSQCADKRPLPSTTSFVLFVMVVVLWGVNWVNERTVHY